MSNNKAKEKKKDTEKSKKPSGRSTAKTVRKMLADENNLFLFLICVFGVFTAEYFLCHVMIYEMRHAYTADAPLYWAVGRGMLNGLVPYSDMYENKPIGIFAISALSFLLTDDTVICNIVSVFAALVTAVIPALVILSHYKSSRDKADILTPRVLLPFFTALFGGIVLASYCEDRSGAFQVEAIGTAFSMLFIWFSRSITQAQKRSERIVRTALAALFISCAVMMKEPFLLIACAGALIFMKDFTDALRAVVIPCVAGGVATVAVLAVTGLLKPYLTIYVAHMFGTRLSGSSSAVFRARDINILIWDIVDFDYGAALVFLIFAALTISAVVGRKELHILLHMVKFSVMVYAAGFCVGMGGQYYDHHFIFGAPIIGAFIMYGGIRYYDLLKEKKIPNCAAVICYGLVMLIAFSNGGRIYAGDYEESFQNISAKARYVDDLLDYYEADRYQYIGFNGEDAFYGLTKHSPQGPVFAQDWDNFRSIDTWFSQQLFEQLESSDIVIVKELELPELNDRITRILDSKFSTDPPGHFDEEPPEDFDYTIYYRNRQSLRKD